MKSRSLFSHNTAQKPEIAIEALEVAAGCRNNLGTWSGLGGRHHHRHCFHLLGLRLEDMAKAVMLYKDAYAEVGLS